MQFRRSIITVAAIVAAAALAFTAPGMAKGLFDARNAHKVDGLHANQIAKTQYYEATRVFDNFDTCAYTSVLTRTFKTTHSGLVSATSAVSAARDTSDPNEGILTSRILIDGEIASVRSSANLENDGTQDETVVNFGARKVPRGKHIIEVQVQECGPGMAFIHNESLLASYSPFGGAAVPPVTRPSTKGSVANR